MTIKDLSAQTGYSVGTVSRVLNNQPNVSPKAREAILEAAAKSGFQLNANAKQLKQRHSNSVLVVVRGTANELFGSMMEIIQARMAATSYQLIVDYVDEGSNEVVRALQLCREKKPLGILFLGGNRDHFREDFGKIEVPCVLVTSDASGLQFPNLSSVSTDDALAARTAVEALVDMGHRQIGVIGGDRAESDIAGLRYRGCLEAFRERDIDFDEERDYEEARFSFADGYRAARNLLAQDRNHTAIFAMADVMAIGAIRALRDAGLEVPRDVAVMGFDGLAVGGYTVPTLSTVCQGVEEMANRSIAMLLENIESCQAPRHETVAFGLQLRESTK